jgi:hypothetical protein
MESPRYRRPVAAFVLMGMALGGLAACTGDGKPAALPSHRPSAEATVDRTTRPTPDEEKATTKVEEPEPTPTRARTAEEEPTRTQEPTATKKPNATQERAATQQPTKSQERTATQEPTPTQEPTKTQEPAATTTSAAVVPVAAENDTGIGVWGWLVLLALFTALVGVLLVKRSRRFGTWDAESHGLAGETRTVTGVRLPPVLTTPDAARRGLAWPPVRDDLAASRARWAALLERAPDGERQAYASQVARMLQDLVIAVDAENEAIAAGRDWGMLRPRVNAIIAALSAALAPAPTPGYQAPAPEPPSATNEYGEPVDEDPGRPGPSRAG